MLKLKEKLGGILGISLWMNFVLFMLLTAQQLSVSSAPLTALSNNQSFFDRLYLNASDPSCTFLPNVSRQDYAYVSSKINLQCSSNHFSQVPLDSANENATRINLCNSLTDVFKMLCKLSKNNSTYVNASTSTLDLRKVGSLGTQTVCAKIKGFISQHMGGSSVILSEPPAGSINSADDGDSVSCNSLCKNVRITREGFSEYSDLSVHPTCILLFEGYTRYQQKLSLSSQALEISRNPALAPKIDNVVSSTSSIKDGNPTIPTSVLESKINDDRFQPAAHSDIIEQANEKPEIENGNPSSNKVESKQSVLVPENEITNHNPTIEDATTSNSEKHVTKIDEIELRASETPENNPESNKIPTEEQKFKDVQKISSSTSTSTAASVDIIGNEELLPIENMSKSKSSTAIPQVTAGSIVAKLSNIAKDNPNNGDGVSTATASEKNLALENIQQSTQAKNKIEDADVLADLADDGTEYGGDDIDKGMVKPPSKFSEDKDIEIPLPETQNLGYDPENSLKPSKPRFSGNTFREDIDFSRGTTINVSLKESEDTGFFSYFLFCVTLVGAIYLIVHNKKKLIAYVVEGRRPRSRGRRSSGSGSGSQYKRLENNFD